MLVPLAGLEMLVLVPLCVQVKLLQQIARMWLLPKAGGDTLLEENSWLRQNLVDCHFMLQQLTPWKHRGSEYVVPFFIVVLFV